MTRTPNYTIKSCGKSHPFCVICRPDMSTTRRETSIRINSSQYLPYLTKSLEDVLRDGNQCTIRRRLSKGLVISYTCAICQLLPEWEGISLTLQLDHIDGNRKNNELSNLRFLCPNCHSQTPTYGGKGRMR